MPNFSTWLISPRQRLHGATKAAYLGLNAGYIHRVRLTGAPQRHDLNWLEADADGATQGDTR
jgi:hypothetical protein